MQRHNRNYAGRVTKPFVLRCALAALILAWNTALADEGGVPFWTSGSYASLTAVPPTPGWSLPIQGYYYSGQAPKDKAFTTGDSVTLGLKSRESLLQVQPTYAPTTKVLGGQLSLGLGYGYGNNASEVGVSLSPRGIELDRGDSVWGFSDLYPIASLAWTAGAHNWMTYITGDIPVGSYDSKRLSNIGLGHAAIDAGGAYTYMNNSSGREASVTLGFTYNGENPSTNYKSGIDSHLDWAASQFVSEKWEIGVAGYVYYQLTGDSGSGAKLGNFKSRIAAIGPEVGYAFTLNGLPAYANVRGYWEFWAENRLEGYALFATIQIPL